MTHYEIQDYNIVVGNTTYVAKHITMVISYQVGMTEMSVPYGLYDANGLSLWGQAVNITQQELDNWGEDDMYIVNLVTQKVGVTLV